MKISMNITLFVVLLSCFTSAERQNLRGLKENKKNAVREPQLGSDYDGYYRSKSLKSLKRGVRNLEKYNKKSEKKSAVRQRHLGPGYEEYYSKSLKKHGVRNLEKDESGEGSKCDPSPYCYGYNCCLPPQPTPGPDVYPGYGYYGGKKGGHGYYGNLPPGGIRNLEHNGKKGGNYGGVRNLERDYPDNYRGYYGGKKGVVYGYYSEFPAPPGGIRNLGHGGKKGGNYGGVRNLEKDYPDNYRGYYGGKKGVVYGYYGEFPAPPGGGRNLGLGGKKGGYYGGIHNERQLDLVDDRYYSSGRGEKKGGNYGGVRNLGGYYGSKKGKYYN